jgi:hypothetical protein
MLLTPIFHFFGLKKAYPARLLESVRLLEEIRYLTLAFFLMQCSVPLLPEAKKSP